MINKLMNRFYPRGLWTSMSRKNQAIIKESQLILSFDCDTQEDFKVAWEVHTRLLDMGIKAVYAVPGELLVQGKEVYKKVHASGSEFINHGGREHTYFDKNLNRYASCFFYEQQTSLAINEDIDLGHKIIQDVLGVTPIGWRTPHFGTFQSQDQLDFLYSVLNRLNYKFSTSTVPAQGYAHGSFYKVQGIIEFPVTGVIDAPANIMDTWAYFEAPDRSKEPKDYITTCQSLAKFASDHPMLINIYGDPSHIHDHDEFFEGLKILSKIAKNTNYSQLIGQIDGNIRDL